MPFVSLSDRAHGAAWMAGAEFERGGAEIAEKSFWVAQRFSAANRVARIDSGFSR